MSYAHVLCKICRTLELLAMAGDFTGPSKDAYARPQLYSPRYIVEYLEADALNDTHGYNKELKQVFFFFFNSLFYCLLGPRPM